MNRKLPNLRYGFSCLLLSLCSQGVLASGDAAPSVLIETSQVATHALVENLHAFGVLHADPDQVLSLSLPQAGLINRVWVRLGQRVSSGDQLMEIITAPEARMQYLQARSAVDFAERELQRQQRLFSEQLATTAQVDAARKAVQDGNTNLKALQLSGQDNAQETLRAPMDGIVTQIDVSQGQRVQAGTTAMLIAAEHRLIARLGVEPEDLAGIQVGTPVIVTSVFEPDINIPTTVREVHGMIDPATQLVEVLAEIPIQPDRQLILGSRIVGLIQLATTEGLVVPRSAILGNADKAYVFTVNGNKAHRVPVQTGLETGDLVEIKGSLKAGDVVVITGNYELTDGMAVREAH